MSNLPINPDAEQSVLGSILLDPSVVDELDDLQPEDFYSETNRNVLRAIRKVRERGDQIELVTVIETMRQDGKIREAGDVLYVTGLGDVPATAAYVHNYASVVKEKRRLRDLVTMGNFIRGAAMSEQWVATDLYAEVERRLTELKLSSERQHNQHEDYITGALAILDHDNTSYIRTPFGNLNNLLGLTGMVVVGGRPSMGKSAFLRDLLRFHAMKGNKVALFGQDQSGQGIYRFEACLRAGVPLQKLKDRTATREEIDKYKQAIASMKRNFHDRFAVDTYPYPIDQLASRIRKAARWGATLIGVDYLQLIAVPGTSAEGFVAAASHVSKVLKHLSNELAIPIIALAQLNRGVEMRSNKRPMLADLRETGQIEQDADSVLFLYRDAYYASREKGLPEPKRSETEVIVAKQKEGPTGVITLEFNGEFATFMDMDHE